MDRVQTGCNSVFFNFDSNIFLKIFICFPSELSSNKVFVKANVSAGQSASGFIMDLKYLHFESKKRTFCYKCFILAGKRSTLF